MGLSLLRRTYFAQFFVKLIVVVKTNKAVVGSGHGDMPKYVGESVALCSITLHVNCKIAVFHEHSSTYHGKDGHKS